MLSFTGNKVLFDKSGISFDSNKPDKYSLIPHALQLYLALLNDYQPGVLYKCDITHICSDEDELNELFKKTFDFNSLKESFEARGALHVDELLEVSHHRNLNDEDIRAWSENVESMRKYIVQRSVNKSAFYHIIENIVNLIKKHRISEIHIPISSEFSRIVVAIQGVLLEKKVATVTDAKVCSQNRYIEFTIQI